MDRKHTLLVRLFWLIAMFLVAGCATPVSGLRPEYPPLYMDTFSRVDSLQPTMRWEASRISNVTYDLKIYRAENDYPAEAVYERQGLTKPYHKIEQPLEPSTKYFWTVRVRFEHDGQPRVTRWGAVWLGPNEWGIARRGWQKKGGRIPLVPHPYYYRFTTPFQPKPKGVTR